MRLHKGTAFAPLFALHFESSGLSGSKEKEWYIAYHVIGCTCRNLLLFWWQKAGLLQL